MTLSDLLEGTYKIHLGFSLDLSEILEDLVDFEIRRQVRELRIPIQAALNPGL